MVDVSQLEKYFAPDKSISPAVKTIAGGLVVLLIGAAASSTMMILVGLLVIAAGGFWIYQIKSATRVSDAEVQEVIDAGARPALDEAYRRFGLVPESLVAEEVVLVGQDFKSVGKRGEDGVWRTAGNIVNVLLFSEKSVHLYSHRYNILKPQDRAGSTEEYFYRHIVSVSTSEREFEVSDRNGEHEMVRLDLMLLRNSGGQPIELLAYNDEVLHQAVASARSVIQQRQD
ncbi:hypothetical protein [Gordonia phthalatica]|uniref:Uncharacterized protein n=1 Tax=Gordonia phthalatica TaxID=1136941 RepID=A0A0N9ND41_9ACTN|nr:hypothetical protein [Gordonia phthalatica]ALG86406.1 hypothetical protein ACH46_20300 [Gordonia phthalatica]